MENALDKLSLDDQTDELDRMTYAKNIANKISAYDYNESMTIGILGKWSSGKTTTIQMIRDHIDQEKVTFINFNPYFYAQRHQLCSDFFKVLSENIQMNDPSNAYISLQNNLLQYAKCLLPITYIHSLEGHLPPVGYKGAKLYTQEYSLPEHLDISRLKNALKKDFEAYPKKILVIMDDIDYLEEHEILEVFKIVHSLGDFNKLIYLLAMDKTIIESAFDHGNDYLHQVIQIPLYLSEIGQTKINHLFSKKMKAWITSAPTFDKDYWNVLNEKLFINGFTDIREVERFINTIKFEYNFTGYNLNIVDYLVVTYLKLFEQKLYLYIKNHKNQMLARNISIYTGRYREILPCLFPAKDDALKNRIYQIDMFDLYFLD